MLRLRQLLPKPANGGAVALADTDALPLAVLEFQSPTAAVIATPVPPFARNSSWYLSALVLSLLVIAGVKKIDKQVPTTGVLVSSASDDVVQVLNQSLIQSINVHPGDLVTRGEVLATLNPKTTQTAYTSFTSQEQNYAAQVAALKALENGTPYMADPNNPYSVQADALYNQLQQQYTATMQDYVDKISSLQATINGDNQQADYYRQRLGGAEQIETMDQQLYNEHVGPLTNLLSSQDTVKSMQANIANAVSSAQTSQQDLQSQRAERDAFAQQFKSTISQQLATAENNLAQAQQQLAVAQQNNDLVTLTAPQDGVVQSVAGLSVGSVVQPGQSLMQITPTDSPLSIETDVDSSQEGYVRVGQKVEIKFNTLPFMQYGDASGHVTSISPESFNGAALNTASAAPGQTPMPGQPQDYYFKVQISLDELNLHNTPPGFRLVPGMPLEADIKTGTRTILGFFIQRMLPIAYDSMHEP